MPGLILTAGSSVLCSHPPGQAKPTSVFAKVTLSGQPVVTQPAPWSITGCALTGTTTPPCVTAQWTSAATKVLAGGMPVLLFDSQAVCTPTGTGLRQVSTQFKVNAT